MEDPAIAPRILAPAIRDRAARRLGRAGVRLPSFAELADPSTIGEARLAALGSVDPDRPEPANLFRLHWYNDALASGGLAATPAHLVLPPALTGVRAPIVVALGALSR